MGCSCVAASVDIRYLDVSSVDIQCSLDHYLSKQPPSIGTAGLWCMVLAKPENAIIDDSKANSVRRWQGRGGRKVVR